MSGSILVPVDGTDFAVEALPWAIVFAVGLGASVDLLRVIEEPDGTGARPEDVLVELAGLAARTPPGVIVNPNVAVGPLVDSIVDRAAETTPLLIAMASHGRDPLQRALHGSIAGDVIRRIGRPVLVIRPGLSRTPAVPSKVLVPVDGSDLSASVVPAAAELTKQLHGTVVFFTVLPSPPPGLPIQGATIPLGPPTDLPSHTIEHVERLAADLERQNVRTEMVVGSGDRAEAIIRQAEESRCGLIAMSTHGRGWLGRLAFGSVTEAVISSAQVPVLVFHPAEAAAHSVIIL